MIQFKEYAQVSEAVEGIYLHVALNEGIRDKLKQIFSRGREDAGDRIIGSIGELGKGLIKGALGTVTEPLRGIGRAIKRGYYGADGEYGTENRDIQNNIEDAKKKIIANLTAMDPSARKAEIEKLKQAFDSVRDMNKDSMANKSWLTRTAYRMT